MEAPTEGPFPFVQVYTNGTIALQCRNNVLERINIRRLSTFKQLLSTTDGKSAVSCYTSHMEQNPLPHK